MAKTGLGEKEKYFIKMGAKKAPFKLWAGTEAKAMPRKMTYQKVYCRHIQCRRYRDTRLILARFLLS